MPKDLLTSIVQQKNTQNIIIGQTKSNTITWIPVKKIKFNKVNINLIIVTSLHFFMPQEKVNSLRKHKNAYCFLA